MKYANIKFKTKGVKQSVGDNIQLFATDLIYEKMGIPKEDIIYIDKNDLKIYDGEPVILPISWALIDYVENGWAGRFSDKITPVFIGLNMAKDFLCEEEVKFFKKYEPIGCRDERTYNTLKLYGINVYISGCITVILLPERENKPNEKDGKIYIVDLEQPVIDLLPDYIKKDAIFTSHYKYNVSDIYKETYDQFKMYYDNAKLVVTSLLHCTSPCLAAGIPVVCIRTNISYRFAWIEKLIKLYTVKDIPNIDWHPKKQDLSYIKELVLNITIKRLKNPKEIFPELLTITNYYLDREKNEYYIDCFQHYKEYINSNLPDKNKAYTYSIWGLTQMSEMLVDYMSKNYPNSKLISVYDKYRKLNFYGLQTKSSDEVNSNEDFLFVTTEGATHDGIEKINNGRLNKSRTCLYFK